MKLNIFSYPLDAAAWFSMFRNADDPLRLKNFYISCSTKTNEPIRDSACQIQYLHTTKLFPHSLQL